MTRSTPGERIQWLVEPSHGFDRAVRTASWAVDGPRITLDTSARRRTGE